MVDDIELAECRDNSCSGCRKCSSFFRMLMDGPPDNLSGYCNIGPNGELFYGQDVWGNNSEVDSKE